MKRAALAVAGSLLLGVGGLQLASAQTGGSKPAEADTEKVATAVVDKVGVPSDKVGVVSDKVGVVSDKVGVASDKVGVSAEKEALLVEKEAGPASEKAVTGAEAAKIIAPVAN